MKLKNWILMDEKKRKELSKEQGRLLGGLVL
jgi:hypothetical protein